MMNSSDERKPAAGEAAPDTEAIADVSEAEDAANTQDGAETNDSAPLKRGDSEEKTDFSADLFDWAGAMMSAVVIIMLLFACFVSVFSVSQSSMTNTLQEGEMLLISNLFYTPQQGDIIMFTKTDVVQSYDAVNDRNSPLVKRVIGVGGDTLYYDSELKKIVRNGEPLDEPYLRDQDFELRPDDKLSSPLTVPEGFVFVCGDNREHSLDSRSFNVVDNRMVLGRVLLRLFPLNRFGTV